MCLRNECANKEDANFGDFKDPPLKRAGNKWAAFEAKFDNASFLRACWLRWGNKQSLNGYRTRGAEAQPKTICATKKAHGSAVGFCLRSIVNQSEHFRKRACGVEVP